MGGTAPPARPGGRKARLCGGAVAHEIARAFDRGPAAFAPGIEVVNEARIVHCLSAELRSRKAVRLAEGEDVSQQIRMVRWSHAPKLGCLLM